MIQNSILVAGFLLASGVLGIQHRSVRAQSCSSQLLLFLLSAANFGIAT